MTDCRRRLRLRSLRRMAMQGGRWRRRWAQNPRRDQHAWAMSKNCWTEALLLDTACREAGAGQ
eukprot:9451637-Pyramimonas_sp.AAC.1